MGVEEHRRAAQAVGEVKFSVLTISDTRSEAEDVSGKGMVELLQGAGHKLVRYRLVPNEPAGVTAAVQEELKGEADLILTTGGTGLSSRDLTIESVTPFMEKVLPGFGELFRSLSYRDIGAAALMSRATMGLAKGKLLVCLPGSEKGVRLALNELIIPEIKHLLREAKR